MTPTPQVEAAGLRAYEQARAFEALERRRLPFIYGAVAVLLALGGVPAWNAHHPVWSVVAVLAGFFFGMGAILHWQRLKARHATNLLLLAQLEAHYGEELPWLKVEKHLAELEKIRAEMERDRFED